MENKDNLMRKYLVVPGVLTLWIILCVYIFDTLFLKMGLKAGWPAYFACIFFFEMGMDPKKLKHIFGGGTAGLLIGTTMPFIVNFLMPTFSHLYALLIMLLLLVFIIMTLEGAYPVFFNNVTFTYFVLSFMFMDQVPAYTVSWLIELFLGAGMLNLGLILMVKLLNSREDNDEKTEVQQNSNV